jgi:hypothetical protein
LKLRDRPWFPSGVPSASEAVLPRTRPTRRVPLPFPSTHELYRPREKSSISQRRSIYPGIVGIEPPLSCLTQSSCNHFGASAKALHDLSSCAFSILPSLEFFPKQETSPANLGGGTRLLRRPETRGLLDQVNHRHRGICATKAIRPVASARLLCAEHLRAAHAYEWFETVSFGCSTAAPAFRSDLPPGGEIFGEDAVAAALIVRLLHSGRLAIGRDSFRMSQPLELDKQVPRRR